MSDNWITLIPEDPHHVPDRERQVRALERYAQIAPKADSLEIELSEKVRFFDCGGNFERIMCPTCHAEIPITWFQRAFDEDADDGFKLLRYETPCCQSMHTLHELDFRWPEGFGRFGLTGMNPGIGLLQEEHKRELEEILGTKLRVIYQHI